MSPSAKNKKKRKKNKQEEPKPLPFVEQKLSSKAHFWTVIALVFIYGIGFYVRYEDYPDWLKHKEMFFYQDQPVLTNGDGYYYLHLAKDLAEGRYQGKDPLRAYPDGYSRPSPPPLIVVMISTLHKIFGKSIDVIAVFLPALLGPLILLPIYGLARVAGGRTPDGINRGADERCIEFLYGSFTFGFSGG